MKINKKMIKILVMTLAIVLILGNIVSVKAAGATVTVTPSTNRVQKGERFTITISGNSGSSTDTIALFTAALAFDESKLRITDSRVPFDSSSNFKDITEDEVITVMEGGTAVTQGDMYTIEFEVLNTVSDGETISITLENPIISVGPENGGNDSQQTTNLDDITVNVTVGAGSGTTTPTPTGSGTTTPTPTGSGTTTPTPTGSGTTTTPTPTGDETTTTPTPTKSGNVVVIDSSDEDDTTSTKTSATTNTAKSGIKTLPDTGISSIIIVGIVLVGIATTGLYFANKKYRGI